VVVTPALVYFSLLQLNDPDPMRWIVIYGMGALVTGITIFKPLSPVLYMIVGLLTLSSFLLLLPQVLREAVFSGTEIERELLGMLLLTIIMAIFWVGFGLERSGGKT
jgi:uncharacterized membrane protein